MTRFRLITVQVGRSLTLNELTMQGGRAPNGAGAGQNGAEGGGIFANGSLYLNRSTVTGNEAGDGGDNGVLGGNGGRGGHGGGIWVTDYASITNSTISGNTAGHGGDARTDQNPLGHIGGDGGDGGGIAAAGAILSVTNSTVVGNSAGNGGAGYNPGGDGGRGGGLFVSATGFGGAANVTMSGNGAGGAPNGVAGSGGGAHLAAGSSVVAKNTIIANSSAGGNCSGAFAAGSTTNMSNDSSCGGSFTLKSSGEINLGPLADNGGPTFTVAFNIPSVAIDAGDNATCAAAPVNNLDQRGVTRPIDGDNNGSAVCDLGAFESPALQADPNFVVNTTSEEDDGACHPLPLDCSLREAINAANANVSPSTITLGSAETYTLTIELPQIGYPLTINGNGSTIYRDFPAPRFRVITSSASSLTLNNLTIRGGRAPEGFPAGANGGGVSATGSLVLNNSLVIANEAGTGSDNPFLGGTASSGGNGGGIWVSGDATIANSTISGNSAGHGGTALANGGIGGDGGYGGGVYVYSGSLNVTNSTIVGNSTGNGGYGVNPGGDGGNGGGFYVPAGSSGALTNVTMSGNSAGGAQNGASGLGGGGYLVAGSSVAAKNTIIANSNIGGNCSGSFGAASTNNLSSDASCGGSFTVKNYLEINLGPLQDNGGPTFTMVPRQVSAAIDAGSNAVCAAAPVNNLDQRGAVRPVDGDNNGSAICDIGAFEAPPVQAPPTFTVNSTAPDDDSLCQLPPADCTLREALNAANGDGVASTVVLGNGQVYTLNAIDNGSSGLPQISTDITIQGNGSTIARGGGAPQFRIFEVAGPGILRLNWATATGGYAPDSNTVGGGAILIGPTGAAHITGSTISGNRAGDGTLGALDGKPGGGIFAWSATLSLTDSTVTGNAAGNGAVGSTGAGGLGGGIYSSGAGTLTVSRSTIAGNTAGNGGSVGGPGGWGGGLFIQTGATASITNSTIANNTAGSGGTSGPGGGGGGVHNQAINLAMTNVTLSGNAVGSGTIPGLGGNISSGNAIVAKNTIVSAPALGENCAGAPFNVASATNLASDGTCGPSFTQQTAGQINLGPLANNGGPTQTMALILPSAALDAGSNTTCAATPVNNIDQRGAARPFDGDNAGGAQCDVGAFEYCPDSDVDAVCNGVDNCPAWANAAQNLPPWPVPAGDSDCDGFNATREAWMGTDPLDHCNNTSAANDEPVDAWPPDNNDDQKATLGDVLRYIPVINSSAPGPPYNARYDLNASGGITLTDVLMYIPFMFQSCAP